MSKDNSHEQAVLPADGVFDITYPTVIFPAIGTISVLYLGFEKEYVKTTLYDQHIDNLYIDNGATNYIAHQNLLKHQIWWAKAVGELSSLVIINTDACTIYELQLALGLASENRPVIFYAKTDEPTSRASVIKSLAIWKNHLAANESNLSDVLQAYYLG